MLARLLEERLLIGQGAILGSEGRDKERGEPENHG